MLSIHKLTTANTLDDAVEDELVDRNPARGKRMRVRVPRPSRSFLEMDELVAVIEAAEEQDRPPIVAIPVTGSTTRDRVARLAASGIRQADIAAQLGLAKSTVTYHLANLGAAHRRPYGGRRAIIETLGRSGVRVSELCDLLIGDVRPNDGRSSG